MPSGPFHIGDFGKVLRVGICPKLRDSLSLTVSLSTMVVGFMRYSRDQSFAVLVRNRTFLIGVTTRK